MSSPKKAADSKRRVEDAKGSEEDAFVFEEVEVDDEEDGLKYEEVPAEYSDEEEDLESALQKAKTQKDGVSLPPISGGAATKSEPFAVAQTTDRRDPEKKAEVTERPTVVDDFIRNFLIKIGMKKTLETFQTEWYELKAKGKLNPEDVGVVPDIYARNEKLDDQVKQLRLEVDKSKALADQAKATWDKFRRERDFHRMHHRRVVQEKNMLVRDMKRLKKHYSTFQPALESMRLKYEQAMKDKMLMKLERDRVKTRTDALEEQLRAWESGTRSGTAGPADRGLRSTDGEFKESKFNDRGVSREKESTSNRLTAATKSSRLKTSEGKRAASAVGGAKAGSGAGAGTRALESKEMKSTKPLDSVIPPDDRTNTELNATYEPVAAEKFSLRKSFKGHRAAISGMAIHPKKPILCTVSDDMTWKLWSIPKGELLMSGDGHKDWVAGCEFHPRAALLATSSGDGSIKLWDFVKRRCTATFSDHSQAVWDVSFHECGDFLLSASHDHTAKLWDINSERCRQTFRGHVDSVNSVTFQPFTNNILTASGDKSVSLWDMRSGLGVQTFFGHNNAVLHAEFNGRGDQFVSSDADGIVKIWDLRSISELRQIQTSDVRHAINDARFDRSGQVVAVASDNGLVKMYSVADGKQLAELSGHEDSVHTLAWDPRGEFLVSCGSDATFKIWA